ncbi:MAG: adenylate/guanylate cyclase domain-containing protein [Chitinophagales bacterium]
MNVFAEIDTLKAELVETADGQTKAELLVRILKKYDLVNSTEGEPFTEELLALALSINNKAMEGYVHFFKGGIRASRQQYLEAIEEFDKAVYIFETINDKVRLTDCYNGIAMVYIQQDHDAEALKYYLKCLKLAEETGQERSQVLIAFNMGIVYQGQGDLEKALQSFEKAREYFERVGDYLTLARCCQNIGAVMVATGRYAEARPWYTKSLDLSRKIGEQHLVAALSSNLGLVDLQDGDVDSAITNYCTAIETAEKLGESQELIAPLINLGEAYAVKKDYNKAVEYLQRSIDLSQKINAKRQLQEALRCMYVLYKEKGETGEALDYYERYVTLTLELKGEDVTRKIASLQFEYKIEKKEQEVKLEREKKEEIQQAYHLLDKEKQRSESLLLNILPEEVAEELKETGSAKAKLFDNVTVLFTDFKSFTKVSERLTPQELVNELDACFRGFDEIMGKYGIEKIKTVGDAYLAVCGLPVAEENHATIITNAALEIRDFMASRHRKLGDKTFEVRIGLHSGSVVAGIVGVKKFAYDIWGDTVNTAARMEQNGEAGKVNVSEATYNLIKDKFNCEYRGELDAKNKGKLKMYFIESAPEPVAIT